MFPTASHQPMDLTQATSCIEIQRAAAAACKEAQVCLELSKNVVVIFIGFMPQFYMIC